MTVFKFKGDIFEIRDKYTFYVFSAAGEFVNLPAESHIEPITLIKPE